MGIPCPLFQSFDAMAGFRAMIEANLFFSRETAVMMERGRCRTGTSGWSYQWWRGIFYPENLRPGDWLAHYVQVFDAVEVNATFYRLPRPELLERWRRIAPDGFLYALKAPRRITHMSKLRDCEAELATFLQSARQLGSSLGPLLYQLPPSLKADAGLLRDFLALLPEDLRHVMEFRHESWFSSGIRSVLEARGCAFCIHDHHGMDVPHWVTAPFAYWRFHGPARGTCYGREGLAEPAAEIRRQCGSSDAVFAFFNNDAAACAPRDALILQELVTGTAP